MKPRWEILEEWLIDHDDEPFTAFRLAKGLNISVGDASALIQAYLVAQRSQGSETLYVLKRQGRTRAAEWSIGERTSDAHRICGTLFEDVQVKVNRAFKPDLDHLREKNPRAARYVEAKLVAVMDGALQMLAVALDAEDGFGDYEHV
jgi:hypothetical protein